MTEGALIFHMEAGEPDNRFHLRATEETFALWKDYKEVGSRTVFSLEAHFPNKIYGVKLFPGLDSEEAMIVGQKMVEWAKSHGQEEIP